MQAARRTCIVFASTLSLTLALLLAIASAVAPARAHDHYSGWQRPDGKGSCCNNQDCRPVAYRDTAGGVEVRIDELGGTWHKVPLAAVLPFGSPDDRAHACYALAWRGPHFFCVALPANM